MLGFLMTIHVEYFGTNKWKNLNLKLINKWGQLPLNLIKEKVIIFKLPFKILSDSYHLQKHDLPTSQISVGLVGTVFNMSSQCIDYLITNELLYFKLNQQNANFILKELDRCLVVVNLDPYLFSLILKIEAISFK